MRKDGGVTLEYGDRSVGLTHAQGAAIARRLTMSMRVPQRTRHGARLTIPLALLAGTMGEVGWDRFQDGLARDMALDRLASVRTGRHTSATLHLHDLAFDHHDLIERPSDAGPERGCEAADDPVLSRLMKMHDTARIVRAEPGVDLFSGGLEERQTSFGPARPYHRLTGLPPGMPPLLVRAADGQRPSCMAVWFSDGAGGALYCNEAGSAWLGIAAELPASVIAQLPGRPATDLVGHAALEGWQIGAAFDHDPGNGPNAFELAWRP